MTLILQGTDNSASSPAVQGGTAGTTTGVYYPASNQIALAANGAQALLANSSQGVQIANTLGVGATTPSTSGAGITFPASQSASSNSNTLDDYETGSFSPTIVFQNGSTGITYTTQTGFYTKIGNLVTIQALVQISNKGSSSGISFISNLPFVSSGTNNYSGGSIGYVSGFTGSGGPDTAYIDPAATRCVLFRTIPAQYVQDTDFTNSTLVCVELTYRAA